MTWRLTAKVNLLSWLSEKENAGQGGWWGRDKEAVTPGRGWRGVLWGAASSSSHPHYRCGHIPGRVPTSLGSLGSLASAPYSVLPCVPARPDKGPQ